MGNEPDDSSLDKLKAEAIRLLDEIKQIRAAASDVSMQRSGVELEAIKLIKTQAEDQVKAIEIARKKADDDASYANLAKISSEEHSKATAGFKGNAEADLSAITTNKKNFDELAATVTANKANLEIDLKAIADGRKTADQTSASLAETARKSMLSFKEIEDSKKNTETILTESKKLRDDVIQIRGKTETAQTDSEQLALKIASLLTKVTEDRGNGKKSADEIGELLNAAKKNKDDLKSILDHLSKSDNIASGHEVRVSQLSKKLEDLNIQAESLLPGAASAGLAHSFNTQRARFALPQKRWLTTFIWCIGGLVIVALPSFFTAVFGAPADSWGVILRSMAMRLPVVIPLVWLAIYAGRNYMVSLRIEEDYAYKEAISRAFEGYKREMKEIPITDAENPTPLNKLCANVLMAIAERPGRIYEGNQKDITPLNEAISALEDFRKKQIAQS